jgi:hypothetical protein
MAVIPDDFLDLLTAKKAFAAIATVMKECAASDAGVV